MRANIDIQINGNILAGRQGWAYICNSGKFTVLRAEINPKEDDEKGYAQFGKVKVSYKSRTHGELDKVGTLEVEKSRWFIGGSGCCIKSGFGYSDMKELMENAQLQTVHAGDIIAVVMDFTNIEFACINLFKVGKVDPNCSVMAELTPLNDEEMEQVKADATKWCNR